MSIDPKESEEIARGLFELAKLFADDAAHFQTMKDNLAKNGNHSEAVKLATPMDRARTFADLLTRASNAIGQTTEPSKTTQIQKDAFALIRKTLDEYGGEGGFVLPAWAAVHAWHFYASHHHGGQVDPAANPPAADPPEAARDQEPACKNCRHWACSNVRIGPEKRDGVFSYCRRYPPQPRRNGNAWPTTQGADACGEFMPKPEGAPTPCPK